MLPTTTCAESAAPMCGAAISIWLFREKEGSLLTIQRNGIYIEIENAEEVKFSMSDADPNDPHYRSKNYRTCRNWQFVYKISKLL